MVPYHHRMSLLQALWIIVSTSITIDGFAYGFAEHGKFRDTSCSANRQSSCLCAADKKRFGYPVDTIRRQWITSASAFVVGFSTNPSASISSSSDDESSYHSHHGLSQVTDPETYSALVYSPPTKTHNASPPPLLIVIHGAGKNERDIWNLADMQGEHAGFLPSLIANGKAPRTLLDNFAVVAPYSQGKRSFYEEPRQTFLNFVNWVCSDAGQRAGCPKVDPNRIFLFGFSDGATETVELMTTGRFRGGIIASYGFTGTLPPMAIERLKDVPLWVLHSADDVIFPVQCSDRLVAALRKRNNDSDVIRYSRFDKDQEGFTGSVRGHSTGITASRTPAIYDWMRSL